MNLDLITDVIMLLAAIIGLLGSVFRYVGTPKKGWLLVAVFFLSNLLSDYYWTTYTLVMQAEPDVSEFMAYFGWNIGYVVLLVAALHMRDNDSKRYFNPLMLIPVPVNIVQFIIYIQYGGIFNNIWSVGFTTLIQCVCLQSIIYYLTHKRKGAHIPYSHILFFFFLVTEYGMWTSSCYFLSGSLSDPYYWFALAGYILEVLFAWGVSKTYESYGITYPEKSSSEIKFQTLLQVLVSMIIFVGCMGGYYMAGLMKRTIPAGGDNADQYNLIAVVLFIISVFLVVLILSVIYMSAIRFKSLQKDSGDSFRSRRQRTNLVFTTLITLALMVFTVIYNSRLFYSASVSGVYRSGEDEAENVAAEMDNYLTMAQSTLRVTADTVDLMIESGESVERITRFILDQTEKQARNFDENFTGIYGYIEGEYVDGLGWVPPDDYDPVSRDWYKAAVEGNGDVVIVSPYVDAQTGSVVITIGKLLTESTSAKGCDNVVALDVIVNHIQEVTEEADIGGIGYAMIVNRDGFIVAHHDSKLCGHYLEDVYEPGLLDEVTRPGASTLNASINDVDSTLFVSSVMDQWYVVIVVNNTELFADSYSQLTVNIIVSLTVFLLITVFYYLGYKNEQAYSKKVEEMKIGQQKQEYEAEVLRLEKHSADEANRAKSGFLADMSHEIRTPINAILGMNEMILREAEGSDIIEYAQNIRNSGRNLLSLINSILDFSKIEDGKMEIVPVRYSLRSLVTYLDSSVRERANNKKLALDINVDPALPSEMFGDDTRINQIILNLLTNAIKYTPEGTVTLNISGKEKDGDRILMHVEVKDTGIGIKKEDMSRLFESFERLDQVRNRSIEGTGLGMSITTKLLGLMDSKLEVESEYGKGSVFSFDLWQKIEDDEPVGEVRTYASADAETERYRESFHAPDAHILVVDDTRMNIIVVVKLLKETRIRIDTATSGEEAIELAKDTAYDVILLDQRMPGMDGTQTLKTIRSLDSALNKDNPVICLTADAIRGAKERYMAEGFTDYLTKPVEGRDLEKMLLMYLPKDKVILNTDPAPDTVHRSEPDKTEMTGIKKMMADMKKEGFDTDAAIKYCYGDEEFYASILSEFVTQYDEHKAKLNDYYDNKDWENYTVIVHAVKSTSKMIGAMELSRMALAMENAARENDEAAIVKDHEKTMSMYEDAVRKIRDTVKEDAGAFSLDQEMFEFAPVFDQD